jgi:phosphoglycerol transferase MdoB-like AlkP superfamily enzyme
MPRLSDRSKKAMRASNFVLHNRQTNRGLYSLVCGQYPKLRISTSRMTEYASSGGAPCLPHVLGDSGYQSAFIQAAPLSFMLKDAFAKQAGFDEIYGDKDFEDPIIRTNWGVDDRSLFQKTGRLIKKLSREKKPWFITLLSAGTHHPFQTVPSSAFSGVKRPEFRHAARYLDTVLFEFLKLLGRSGTLNNTLVIITADESRGIGMASDLPALLTQNWGPLVVLLPTRESMILEQPYAQSDIAISILDYLGIDSSSSGFIGRSIFRKYKDTRRIFFANVFQKHSGAVDSAGSVLWCSENGGNCSKYTADPSMLFMPLGKEEIADAKETE